MKLFKVTYQKICNPSKGIYFEEHQGYYLCDSLDKLYHYVENEQHLTLKGIEVLECTIVQNKNKIDINREQIKSLGEFIDTTIIKAI